MNRFLFVLVLVLTSSVLAWGLWTVGGPETARKEKRDDVRFRDIQMLGEHYKCVANVGPDTDQVIASRQCGSAKDAPPDRQDPLTGEAYRYARTGDNSFEVCATFEVATNTDTRRHPRVFALRGVVFEGHVGCRIYVRKNAEAKWIVPN